MRGVGCGALAGGMWPLAAGFSLGRPGPAANEDGFVATASRALLVDGITGDGSGAGRLAAAYVCARWVQARCGGRDPAELLGEVSDAAYWFLRNRGIRSSGASALAASFDARGNVRLAGLGDAAAWFVSLEGTSRPVVVPQRTPDGLLARYAGMSPQFEKCMQLAGVRITPGRSAVLLMSDGVWEHVGVRRLEQALASCAADASRMAGEVVACAREAGGIDDATAVVIA